MENTYACRIYQVNKLDHWDFYSKHRCTREREREPLSAGVQEGHFSLIVATSSNVNSWRGYRAWLWDKCYYLLLEVGALGIQIGRRPGQGPLDTIVMSKEIHHQGEIQDTKIEELCMPSAHKEIPASM